MKLRKKFIIKIGEFFNSIKYIYYYSSRHIKDADPESSNYVAGLLFLFFVFFLILILVFNAFGAF